MPGGLRIELYCLCWNDARMLPHFFKHYDQIVDRYFVFDNGSTDESLYMLENHGRVSVEHFDVRGKSFVTKERRLGDTMWRKSDADWVIVTDIDEFTYHPHLIDYLRRCKEQKITAIRSIGYDMVSDSFPSPSQPLVELVTRGRRSIPQDRLCIFNPKALTATNFGPGRHVARPKGRVVWPNYREVLLLHYKQLGLDYAIGRSAELRLGLRSRDLEYGWGAHYTWRPDEIIASWREVSNASRTVPGLGALKHVEPASYYEERYIQQSGLVDEDWYLASYPDVKEGQYDALSHFCVHGWKEDRKPNFYFDPEWYCANYPKLHTDGRNPLYEYVVRGEKEGAWPSPLFNTGWYRAQHGLSADESPLRHYLQRRNTGLVSPLPDFDAVEYCRKHPQIIAAGRDPFEHYRQRQTLEGRTPFHTVANARAPQDKPLAPTSGHLEPANRTEVRFVRLSGLVDEEWYLATYPDAKSDHFDAVSHYCALGWKEGYRPNFYFDTEWYRENYPALHIDGRNPLYDYIVQGEKKNAWPSPLFDTAWYRAQHGLSLDESPLQHYLQRRKSGLVNPIPGFDAVEYCESHPEIVAAAGDPFEKYCEEQTSVTGVPGPENLHMATSRPEVGSGDPLAERLRRLIQKGAVRILRACRAILRVSPAPFIQSSAFAWIANQETSARYGFDEIAYLEAYPEIATAIRAGEWASGLHHYRVRGAHENRLADKRYILAAIGRTASFPPGLADLETDAPEGFDEPAYLKAFPDVAEAIQSGEWTSALHHYRVHGVGENRLADKRYILAAIGRSAAFPAGLADLPADAPEGFAEAAYLKAFPDVAKAVQSGEWTSALHHYRIHGAQENRLADQRYRLAAGSGTAASLPSATGIDEVVPEGFDGAAYVKAFPDVATAIRSGEWASALHHYRVHGSREDRLADERYLWATSRGTETLSAGLTDMPEVAPEGFDEAAYLTAFSDVATAIKSGEWISALQHYRFHGALENRLADQRYIHAARGFLETFPLVTTGIQDAAPDGFDEAAYLKAYPEFAAAIKLARAKIAWPADLISVRPPIVPRSSAPVAPSPS